MFVDETFPSSDLTTCLKRTEFQRFVFQGEYFAKLKGNDYREFEIIKGCSEPQIYAKNTHKRKAPTLTYFRLITLLRYSNKFVFLLIQWKP